MCSKIANIKTSDNKRYRKNPRKCQNIRDHEKTLSKPKADRLSLLKAVKANLSPIFLLFNDDKKKMVNLCKNISKKKPSSTATDKEKTVHKLWVVDDEKIINYINKIEVIIRKYNNYFKIKILYI